jgi:hypothetical protein
MPRAAGAQRCCTRALRRFDVSRRPRVLVIGCGAIGGIHAAHLSRVAEVVAFDVNREHVAAINRDGLKLIGRTTVTARFAAYAEPPALSSLAVDAVLMLVKSQATSAAFAAVKASLAGQPLLITMQNGLGNVEALAPLCDWDIAHGVSTAGRYVAPGALEHFIHGEDSWLGPARGSLDGVERIGALHDATRMHEVDTISHPDRRQAVTDQYRGAAGGDVAETLEHLVLRGGIHRAAASATMPNGMSVSTLADTRLHAAGGARSRFAGNSSQPINASRLRSCDHNMRPSRAKPMRIPSLTSSIQCAK